MAADITKPNWHVITKSHGGTVSILKNLTLHEAVAAREVATPRWEGMRIMSDGMIVDATIIGPADWDGCEKAGAHQWGETTDSVIDRGPRIGRIHRSRSCALCGQYDSQFVGGGHEARSMG